MAMLKRLNTQSVYAMHLYVCYVYIHLIQYTVTVLEALVHEEVSSTTLRCLHNAKYQCTANQYDY